MGDGAETEAGCVACGEAGFALLAEMGERAELVFFGFVENCCDYVGIAAEEFDSVDALSGDEANPLAAQLRGEDGLGLPAISGEGGLVDVDVRGGDFVLSRCARARGGPSRGDRRERHGRW